MLCSLIIGSIRHCYEMLQGSILEDVSQQTSEITAHSAEW